MLQKHAITMTPISEREVICFDRVKLRNGNAH